jgi:pimeloyl-ACP methyl ester carboxylesterase
MVNGSAHRRLPARAVTVVASVCTAVVLAVTAGCSGAAAGGGGAASPGASTPAGPVPQTLAAYYQQKLTWRSCGGGFQCARLLVPMNYQRPGWRDFSLPVIRLAASNQSQRIGSLVVNPGGPGGSGIQFAQQARSVISPQALARFDVVGFDPRGVGGSQPAVHCLSGHQLDQFTETNDEPANGSQLSALEAESKFFASSCKRESGPLLPYIGTANAARDMDILRAALGDAKLTYLGKSYGTYLGTWYANLFPRKTRALVLDGAVDPHASALDQNITQGVGFETAFRSFAANCMTMTTCPLGHGSDVNAGVAKLQSLFTQTAQHPLRNDLGDGRPAGEALVMSGVVSALYSKQYWPILRTALTQASAGDGTLLIELSDALNERNHNGTYSNLIESDISISCIDRPWPKPLNTWQSAAAKAAKAAPQFGESIMYGSLPCAYWPVPATKVPAMHAAGAPPILVVGTTRDPATPYRQAQALSSELSSGVLLGWNGDGHTAYKMGSSCVDSAVDNYLINLHPPKSGTLCQ